MGEDLLTAAEEHRRRIDQRAREVQRIQTLAAELEAQSHHPAHARAKSTLRQARADLARAREQLADLKRAYARFRLREGLGPDPDAVDDETFTQELLALCTGPLARGAPRGPHQGAIAFETFRQMLLADPPIGQLAENERAERRDGVGAAAADDEYATQRILRRWAAMTEADPYVAAARRRAAAATDQFQRCLADFERRLNDLRVNYEIRQRTADRLAFVVEGQRAVIQAENHWHKVQKLFPEAASSLVADFHALRQAHHHLAELRAELKGELRAFLTCFVPYCVTYVSRQSRQRRRRLGLHRLHPRRLCAYLLEEVQRADLLLPGGGGLEVPLPRIPRQIAAFARTDAYREYRRSADTADLVDAPGPAKEA